MSGQVDSALEGVQERIQESKGEVGLSVVDELLKALPSEMNTLLDLRNAMSGGGEAGTCVRLYFSLVERVKGWNAKKLEALREVLEESICLQVVLEEKDARVSQCLRLDQAKGLEDYCHGMMTAFAKKHQEAKLIQMSFQWGVMA